MSGPRTGNIFHSPTLPAALKRAAAQNHGATVFGYYVDDPRPFGVVEFDANGRAISIEEKPQHPKSNYIIPGLYFYDHTVLAIAKFSTNSLRPRRVGNHRSEPGVSFRRDQLRVIPLDRDFIWLDAGTADSLLVAAQAIRDIQAGGRYVACVEEIARDEGWITTEIAHAIGREMATTNYGKYLLGL